MEMFKATLAQGKEAQDSDEDWESIEDDFNPIGVDELLDSNFQIEKPNLADISDEDEELDLEPKE
jgi:hypothetical protein